MKTRTAVLIAGVIALALLVAAPASAGTRIEKNLKLDPGGRFVLDSTSGAVTLTGGSGAGAKVVITADDDDLEAKIDFKFEEIPGEARVTARKKSAVESWIGGLRIKNFHYEIQVPTRTAISLKTGGGKLEVTSVEGDATLETSGGSILVTSLQGRLKAETSGGGIDLKDVRGPADVETSGGGIEIDGVQGPLTAETSGGHISISRPGGDVKVETSGGGIKIEDAAGRVDAETSGGPIEVIFAAGNFKGGNLETSGGGIRVKIDPKANLRIDAETSGGSVVADVPITVTGEVRRSAISGTIGAGGETLRLRSSGGSIRIGPRS